MEIDYSILDIILDDLHHKNFRSPYDNRQALNAIAYDIITRPNFDVVSCDKLLKICNILYNNTDEENLPIEHGVYDILLEADKAINKNFQVGADITEFTPMIPLVSFEDNTLEKVNLVHIDQELKLRYDESIFLDDILYPDPRINAKDFEPVPPPVAEDMISKRKHDTSHNHPELVGTLDKCKFVTCKEAAERGALNDPKVKILERDFFAEHIKQGIISPTEIYMMVCELKYDGVSVEADCTTKVESARSRGDTGIGQASDMTPIFSGYKFPHMLETDVPIGMKFEAIMKKGDLEEFNRLTGYQYKNCRTAIVGLTNSSDAWKYRDLITLVPLQTESKVFESEAIQKDRIMEIEFMNEFFTSHACPMRYVVISGTYIELLFQIKLFLEESEFARSYIPFMYDGIVVSYLDPKIREQLGRVNFVNKYSMAVKFNPLKKQTIFRGYTYTVGQDGSITPMIHYDLVEFYGTIHPKSSGHSYARFKELDLAIGDIINVEYVNDVMPYVSRPFNEWNDGGNPNKKEEFITECPVCGQPLEISVSGKSIRCTNSSCGGRATARMVNMFTKLNLAEFGEATILKLGKTNLRDICHIYTDKSFQKYGFGDGEALQLSTEMDKLYHQPIKDYDLFGALGFTSLAAKTWKLIFQKIRMQDFIYNMEMRFADETIELFVANQLLEIKGLGQVSVSTIGREYSYFREDILFCINTFNIIETFGEDVTGKRIRATGFRNRGLFEKLRSMGHDADDNGSVTKSTDILLVPYEGYNEGSKLTKVSESCQIVAIDEFINNMDLYL